MRYFIFTYHIVNIKREVNREYLFIVNGFTYHIVNIKLRLYSTF